MPMRITLGIVKKLTQKKVNGGALYIAIMVGIIIGILLTMFILLAKFNQRSSTIYAQQSQLQYNLKSAVEIAKSEYFLESNNDKWFKNTYNDDSIKVKRMYWGAYLLVNAQTKNRHHSLSSSGLYGQIMSSDTGIVVAENGRSIGVSGSVNFKANCYLPKAGIKPAYIEGQSYLGSLQNPNYVKPSPKFINEMSKGFKDGIFGQQAGLNFNSDSLVNFLPTKIKHSFSNKTLVWEPNQKNISGYSLQNNIKIITQHDLVIDSTCHLNNVLIICKKVKFKEGFKGSVHVIASDSILCEKKCEFMFPSSFVLCSQDKGETALKCILLNEECVFYGGIVAFDKNEEDNKVFVKLNATSEVNGFIYSANYLHAEGKLNANVFCNTLLLKTPSAVYENHLLACEVDPGKVAYLMSIPMVFERKGKLVNCKNFGK
jgi:hypothetical protein